MTNHARALRDLEAVWPKPETPAPRPPVPWEKLSDQERADFAELDAVWQAIDVPAGLAPRAEARPRLDALTDDQVDHIARLTERVQALSQEATP